jgi:hypothetical protein
MDAQKLRTPKGLDFIKQLAGGPSHERVLFLMTHLSQVHITIWVEGVWEILRCARSPTKFIISDHPVTTYNSRLSPGGNECRYPFDAPIEYLGTHTIFPLDLNRCLVVTNLGFVRNPDASPIKKRENARYFGNTVFDVRRIQTGREIPEAHVRAINYIIKQRATRYIAAGQEEWLYPEEHMKIRTWDRLGTHLFLMPDPRKVPFSTGMYIGYRNGSSWGVDEYGRAPRDDDPKVIALREVERRAFYKAKAEWDRRYGPISGDDLRRYF